MGFRFFTFWMITCNMMLSVCCFWIFNKKKRCGKSWVSFFLIKMIFFLTYAWIWINVQVVPTKNKTSLKLWWRISLNVLSWQDSETRPGEFVIFKLSITCATCREWDRWTPFIEYVLVYQFKQEERRGLRWEYFCI
jgi:formate/nitrite transporter FocA (FNT family)